MLITVSGRDRPGVSSALFSVLTRHGVDLIDVEQVVVQDRLTLGALVAVHHDPEALQEAVEQAMAAIAMQVETSLEGPGHEGWPGRRPSTHVVVVLGRPITAQAFAAIAQELAAVGANIDAIRRVADYPVTGLELTVSPDPEGTTVHPPGTLRARLVEVVHSSAYGHHATKSHLVVQAKKRKARKNYTRLRQIVFENVLQKYLDDRELECDALFVERLAIICNVRHRVVEDWVQTSLQTIPKIPRQLWPLLRSKQ